MAKVLITLLGILLLLNAMTFLLVAFQDPGGEATAEDNAAGTAIATLEKKVDALSRKVDSLNTLKSTQTRQLNEIRNLTRKIDGLARSQVAARRAPPPRPAVRMEEEPEEELEEEPLEEPAEEPVQEPAEELDGEGDQG